jgi:hypothetical protein
MPEMPSDGRIFRVKTYELKERMSPLIHIYDNFAMCSNGAETLRVELTDEQIIQLAAHVTDRAARILKSRLTEAGRVRGKVDSDAADRGVPGAGSGRER